MCVYDCVCEIRIRLIIILTLTHNTNDDNIYILFRSVDSV